MEEKDIKIIQELIESKNGELLNCWDYGEEAKKSLENLLQAYKQDEKLIKEMAKELRMRQYNCYGKSTKTIIEHFRKKCE